MELSDEQIENLKALAADFHTPVDIGYMLGFSGKELLSFTKLAEDKETKIGEMYFVSRLKSLAEVRKTLVASAKTGNPEALKHLNDFLTNEKIDHAG